jgi:hypothetical protein
VALEEIIFRLFPNLTGGSTTVTNLLIDGQPAMPGYAQRDSVLFAPLPQPYSRASNCDCVGFHRLCAH